MTTIQFNIREKLPYTTYLFFVGIKRSVFIEIQLDLRFLCFLKDLQRNGHLKSLTSSASLRQNTFVVLLGAFYIRKCMAILRI